MKKIYLVLGVLVVVVFVLVWGNSPKYGEIVVNSSEVTVVPKEKMRYENEYFLFYYPDDYYGSSENETFWLVGKSGVMESLTVISKKFDDEVENHSGVKLRQVKKEEYDEEKLDLAGVEATYFVKKDLNERTLFVKKDGVLISFSMLTSFGAEKLERIFGEIIGSWEWKN